MAPGTQRARVVVVGGGIAGLEALMALRDLAPGTVELTLVAAESEFTYKPLMVQEPFSPEPAERHALAPIAAQFGARFIHEPMARIDVAGRRIGLASGEDLAFDAAVICVGGRQRPAYPDAITFRTAGQPLSIDDVLRESAEHPTGRLAFVAPPGATWPLPVYELALMARRRAEELRLGLECVIVTPEAAPLVMFGPVASDSVATLLAARGIGIHAGMRARAFEGGSLLLSPGDERLEVANVIALPVLEGPAIEGLPADEHGFIPIDDHARVRDADGVYAAGDGTNFPIKQGGIGTQQADAAAEHIAARFGASVEPHPFHPVLRGRLLAGDESVHLEADLAGGAGEGMVSADYLWWPPHKVSGRYLSAWLEGDEVHSDLEPPRYPLEVEVALPREWHREPMALDPYGELQTD